jgi:hypothetical protein
MKIIIKSIRNAGDALQERVVLTVTAATDIGHYLLLAGNFAQDGDVSTTVRRTFWFPDKGVKPNDLVVLYTKTGNASEKHNKSGTTSHFFYWGQSEPIWNDDTAAAVLISAGDWEVRAALEEQRTSR